MVYETVRIYLGSISSPLYTLNGVFHCSFGSLTSLSRNVFIIAPSTRWAQTLQLYMGWNNPISRVFWAPFIRPCTGVFHPVYNWIRGPSCRERFIHIPLKGNAGKSSTQRCLGRRYAIMANQPPPPNLPPPEIRPSEGLMNHWSPLIRPALKPLFLGGVRYGGVGWQAMMLVRTTLIWFRFPLQGNTVGVALLVVFDDRRRLWIPKKKQSWPDGLLGRCERGVDILTDSGHLRHMLEGQLGQVDRSDWWDVLPLRCKDSNLSGRKAPVAFREPTKGPWKEWGQNSSKRISQSQWTHEQWCQTSTRTRSKVIITHPMRCNHHHIFLTTQTQPPSTLKTLEMQLDCFNHTKTQRWLGCRLSNTRNLRRDNMHISLELTNAMCVTKNASPVESLGTPFSRWK